MCVCAAGSGEQGRWGWVDVGDTFKLMKIAVSCSYVLGRLELKGCDWPDDCALDRPGWAITGSF